MDDVTQQNAALVEQAAAAAASLQDQAQELSDTTHQFKLSASQGKHPLASNPNSTDDYNKVEQARATELANNSNGRRLKAPKAKKDEDWEEF
jgi:methyl-accepting chemotaxis protein